MNESLKEDMQGGKNRFKKHKWMNDWKDKWMKGHIMNEWLNERYLKNCTGGMKREWMNEWIEWGWFFKENSYKLNNLDICEYNMNSAFRTNDLLVLEQEKNAIDNIF